MGNLFLQFYYQVLSQLLFAKFCHRWHHMYNHKRTLFTVCRHKVLTKTFVSSYSQLNDQANTCFIHFYKRCVSLKVVILIIGYLFFFRAKESLLIWYLITWMGNLFFNSIIKFWVSCCLQKFLTDGTTCSITRGLCLLFAVTRCWQKHLCPHIPNYIQPIPFCSNIT